MNALKSILVAYRNGERGLPTYHELAAIVESSEPKSSGPNCGACPGDGSICLSSCRVSEESPPVPTMDFQTRSKLAISCLPIAGYRAMLENLHSEMLEHITALESESEQLRMSVHNARIEAAELESQLETERMRLAACGVAALSNTAGTVDQRIPRDNPYWSASYNDVCSAVDREMDLREKLIARNEQIAAQAGKDTDWYVTTVPDKSDRIVWRGDYYHLPMPLKIAQPMGTAPANALAIVQATLEAAATCADEWAMEYVDHDHAPYTVGAKIRAINPQTIIDAAIHEIQP